MTRLSSALAALLFFATWIAFQPAVGCAFINFDDPAYVQNNPILHGGMSVESIVRAFTTVQAGYWIPMTWLSYLVDFELSGLSPGSYHRTNVLLHSATAALLFLVLFRMTSALGRSLVAACLFAFHPIQVESVAWVTERKDVLSTFFAVLAIAAHHRYAMKPGLPRYLLVMLCLLLGLMAKPMLVTLPFALLLLDCWPLDRLGLGWKRLLLEKVPLLFLCFVFGVVTILTQRQDTAVRSLDEFSLHARFGNALFNGVVYLRMLAWPHPLAVFYPHPGELPLATILGSFLVLVVITFVAWKLRTRVPALLFGWAWYVLTLAPVSGVLQAGWQGRADRFLYVPSIGLFVALAWGGHELLKRFGPRFSVLSAASLLVACIVTTRMQLRHWHDSLTLWDHAFATTDDSFVLRDSLAAALLDPGRSAEAVVHLERAVELRPEHEFAHHLLGIAAMQEKRHADAERHFRRAVKIRPKYVEARAGLAQSFAARGLLDEAETEAQTALEIAPRSEVVLAALADIAFRRGRDEDGLRLLREAVECDPHAFPIMVRLIAELKRLGRDDEADEQDRRLRTLLR